MTGDARATPLELRIDQWAEEPICGELAGPNGGEPFVGWLALMEAVDRLRDEATEREV